MGADPGFNLGIDGLPLGTHVVAAASDEVMATFDVVDEAGAPLDLERRVVAAVERAVELHGGRPAEVRLVCVDDGSFGDELGRIGERLLAEGVRLQVLDLVLPLGGEGGPADSPPADRAERSATRARRAALW